LNRLRRDISRDASSSDILAMNSSSDNFSTSITGMFARRRQHAAF
jgi:hypothetical protein